MCEEFLTEIKNQFSVPVIGEIRSFKDIFALLLQLAQTERFTVILDAFQEFYTINAAVYSEIQHLCALGIEDISQYVGLWPAQQ